MSRVRPKIAQTEAKGAGARLATALAGPVVAVATSQVRLDVAQRRAVGPRAGAVAEAPVAEALTGGALTGGAHENAQAHAVAPGMTAPHVARSAKSGRSPPGLRPPATNQQPRPKWIWGLCRDRCGPSSSRSRRSWPRRWVPTW